MGNRNILVENIEYSTIPAHTEQAGTPQYSAMRDPPAVRTV
jgi:hypothetical protein